MYKSLTCSTRLSEAQTKKLDILAAQNNLNRSLYIKKILIDHIDNYYENTNILSKNVFQNNQKSCHEKILIALEMSKNYTN